MKLFIGCSSSNEIDKKYLESCKSLLEELLKNNDLVYGAYNNGVMGIAYDIAIKNHRTIYAITTEVYKHELDDIQAEYKIVTPNIYTRSESLIKNSDIVIILPGGIGTITELISSIETMRNNEFNKPIIIYNVDGFYDEFIRFMDVVYKEKFSSVEVKKFYRIFDDQKDIIEYIMEERIKKIEERNKREEEDKAWETSWIRRCCIAILTYIVVVLYTYTISKINNIFFSSLVPVIGFLLSTVSLNGIRKIWSKKYNR